MPYRVLLALCASALLISLTSADPASCDTCKWLADRLQAIPPQLGPAMVHAVQTTICGAANGAIGQCSVLAETIIPEALNWMQRPESSTQMCAEACTGMDSPIPSLTELGARQLARETLKDATTCSMCEHVIGSAQAMASVPITQNQLEEQALAACTELPSEMVVTCHRMVELYLPQIMPVVDRMDASSACAMAGLCTAQAMAHVPVPAMPAALLQHLSPLMTVLTQPANDHFNMCDMCQLTVLDVSTLLTNAAVQQQLTNYSKSLCDSLGAASADSCKLYVDIYAPAVFAMLQTYLKPEPICQGIGMCEKKPGFAILPRATQSAMQLAAKKQMLRAQPASDLLPRGAELLGDAEAESASESFRAGNADNFATVMQLADALGALHQQAAPSKQEVNYLAAVEDNSYQLGEELFVDNELLGQDAVEEAMESDDDPFAAAYVDDSWKGLYYDVYYSGYYEDDELLDLVSPSGTDYIQPGNAVLETAAAKQGVLDTLSSTVTSNAGWLFSQFMHTPDSKVTGEQQQQSSSGEETAAGQETVSHPKSVLQMGKSASARKLLA